MKKNLIFAVNCLLLMLFTFCLTNGCSKKDKGNIPVITTTDIKSITETGVVTGGTIIDDGGLDIISRGITWGEQFAPIIANNRTSNGKGTGSFESSISNLEPGTIYYLRAYATNEAGTAYGNEFGIKTLPENSTDPDDAINIISVSPTSGFRDGTMTSFTVRVNYNLTSFQTGTIEIGFNYYNVNSFIIYAEYNHIISAGSGQYTFNVNVPVRNWGLDGRFMVFTLMTTNPVPTQHFIPLATDDFPLY
jgi:hypothetical protein